MWSYKVVHQARYIFKQSAHFNLNLIKNRTFLLPKYPKQDYGFLSTINGLSNHSRFLHTNTSTTTISNSTAEPMTATLSNDENARLTEVITIYEKLTKSRELGGSDIDQIFSPLSNGFEFYMDENYFNPNKKVEVDQEQQDQTPKVLDFSKFRQIDLKNCSFFSASTGLIQSDTLEGLRITPEQLTSSVNLVGANNFSLLKSKQYWLNLVDPTDADLKFLAKTFHIHDLTLKDIREKNTEEKIEVFKHYNFLSLKLYYETQEKGFSKAKSSPTPPEENGTLLQPPNEIDIDYDFNIVTFPNSIITIHYGGHWSGLKDMLGFLNLLCSYGNSPLTPDWVLYSILIELAQDAKYSVNELESKILNLKVADIEGEIRHGNSKIAHDLSSVLTKNFQNEFEIYKISRFIKPKLKVVKLLSTPSGQNNTCGGGHQLCPMVGGQLGNIGEDFSELLEELNNFSHILERSQDTCLTLANVRQSQEANQMGKAMKRISEVALLVLPLQAVAGLMGMNVLVPLQEYGTTGPFWGIIISSTALVFAYFTFRNVSARLLSRGASKSKRITSFKNKSS